MSSHRPSMSLRATSSTTNSSTKASTTTTPSTNPSSPSFPLTPSSRETTSFPFFSSTRHQPHSQTIDSATSFFRSRSRSPRSHQEPKDLPPTSASHLKYAATSLTDGHSQANAAHHQSRRSESSIPSTPPTSPADARTEAFFQKKRQSSSGYGQYGRHGNDWLFGNVSLTETVKHAVKRKDGK